MRKRTGGQIIVEVLRANGVRAIFGLPGGHNLAVYDALMDYHDIVEVSSRHEQAAGFMADAYARVIEGPAVVLTTAGPGITNILTPVAQSFSESSPLVVLAINNYADLIDQEWGIFHELHDLRSLFAGSSAWYRRVERAADLPYLLQQALNFYRFNRPRPVVLEIPSNILDQDAADVEVALVSPQAARYIADDLLAAFVDRLLAARSAVLYVGGGAAASGAAAEVQNLAELLNIPVITTVQGRGIIADDHPLALGCIWDRVRSLNDWATESDLVVALGTSLSRLATQDGRLPLPRNLIHIDIDPAVIGRLYTPSLGIVADVKAVLRAALDRLTAMGASRPSDGIHSRVEATRQRWFAELAARVPHVAEMMRSIRAAVPRETMFTCDMTVAAYWAMRFLPVYLPHAILSPYYFGSMGFAVPAALGVKLAHPDRPVVALCGDGGFLFNSQELATVRKYGLPIIILLFNDNAYTAMKSTHQRLYQRLHSAFDLFNPDFLTLATAYGWQSVRVMPAELQSALQQAVHSQQATVIEVVLHTPLPMPNDIRW